MSGFDAGEIASRLTVDRSEFQRGLREAKAEADKFSKGQYAAKLKADSSDATRKTADAQARVDKFGRTDATAKLRVKVDNAGFAAADRQLDQFGRKADTVGKKVADSLNIGGRWAQFTGPALLGLPAVINLLGVTTGAVAGLGATFATGGIALAAYGKVASGVLSQASTAAGQVQKAQVAYNAAIQTGTKHSVAYAAEQRAILKAYAGMSPAQIALSKQLGELSKDWAGVRQSLTPVIALSVQPWLKGITDGMGFLKPVVTDVSRVVGSLGISFRSLVNDPAFATFAKFIGREGSATVNAGGGALLNILDGLVRILPQFRPLIDAVNAGITRLGRSFDGWASSAQGRQDVQHFLAWLKVNGPIVGKLLESMGKAVATLIGGFATGGAGTEIRLLTDFFTFLSKLPKNWIGPVSDAVGTLLLLNKLSLGRKIVSVAVNWAGQGAAALLKWLSGGTLDLAAKLDGAGMQRAGNTMLTAAELMQKAADRMAGAAGAADAGGAAGGGAAAGRSGIAGALAALLPVAVPIIAGYLAEHEFLHLLGPQKTAQLRTIQGGQPVPSAGSTAASAALAADPGLILKIGNVLVGVQRNFTRWTGDVTRFFTATLPGIFTKTVPHWFDGVQAAFSHDVVAPVTHAAGNVEHVFTSTIPHWFDSAKASFSHDVVSPIRGFVTGTVPGFFTRTIPHWWDAAGKFFSADVVSPVRGFVTSTIPGFFTRTIPHWWDSAKSAFSTDVVAPLRSFITTAIPGFFTRTIPHWFDLAGHSFASKVVHPIEAFFKRVPNAIANAFVSGLDWVIGKINWLIGKIPGVGFKVPLVPHVGMAHGGVLPGYAPGRDTIPVMASPGEGWLVPEAVRGIGGAPAIDAINRAYAGHRGAGTGGSGNRFAGGGIVGDITGAFGDAASTVRRAVQGALRAAFDAAWSGSIAGPINTLGGSSPVGALVAGGADDVKHALDIFLGAKDAQATAVGSGSGSAIAAWARSQSLPGNKNFYRWGGTKPGAWDCSGFTGDAYERGGIFKQAFGTRAGTSESFFNDSRLQKSGAVPGAMVFFEGVPPGHVGIVLNSHAYAGADGPEGAPNRISSLAGNVGFRIPKGGFGGGSGKGGNLKGLERLWTGAGGPGGNRAHIAAAVGLAESGGRNVVQAGQPYATRGWGIWQITPGNSEPKFGTDRALLKPHNNAEAAVAKYHQAGNTFTPWSTFNSGRYLQFLAAGGTAAPGWAWVGERGAELVHMRGGERVLNHAQSMMAGAGITRGYADGTGQPGIPRHPVIPALEQARHEERLLTRHIRELNLILRKPLSKELRHQLTEEDERDHRRRRGVRDDIRHLEAEKHRLDREIRHLNSSEREQRITIRSLKDLMRHAPAGEKHRLQAELDQHEARLRNLGRQELVDRWRLHGQPHSKEPAGPGAAELGRELFKKPHSGVLNDEIAAQQSVVDRDTALLKVQALSGHDRRILKAELEKARKRLKFLSGERVDLRAYRSVLRADDVVLGEEIAAAQKAGEKKAAAELQAKLDRQVKTIAGITEWLSGAKKKDGSGGGGGSGGGDGGSGGSGSGTTPTGKFVGMMPLPPGSAGGGDFTGGGTGGLGGSGAELLGLPGMAGYPSGSGGSAGVSGPAGGPQAGTPWRIVPSGGGSAGAPGPGGSGSGWGGSHFPEPVLAGAGGGNGLAPLLDRLDSLIAATRQAPGATGGHLAAALNGTARAAYSRAQWSNR